MRILRDYILGPLILAVFLGLFAFMMNLISAPDAKAELGNYVIVVDLILALLFLMLFWGYLTHRDSGEDVLPMRVPSFIGIPIGVALFVFMYVSGLGEALLHVNEVASPALALAVAGCILGGATYLDWKSPKVVDTGHGHGSGHDDHTTGH